MAALTADTVLVGHPFAPIGMGEHIRSVYRSLRRVGLRTRLLDIYGMNEPESPMLAEMKSALTRDLGGVNVFHINGDEVAQVLSHLSLRPDAYNIIYPAWELSRYPEEWARQLDRFDEIWAPSRFIEQSVAPAVQRPVIHMPLACEVLLSSFLGRRYFGIPEGAYAFLFFFDFRSYASRKNPEAVVECFQRLLIERPHTATSLVIKVHGAEHAPTEASRLAALLANTAGRAVVIDRTMTDNEVKNLVRCCDSFVSLHRSEGFGRGLAEAMYLGKPVIATAYSGNMDFTAEGNSFLVRYRSIEVPKGAYPFYGDQVWADPDLNEATRHMVCLVDNPNHGREIGRLASLGIRTAFSYRRAGLRYSERLNAIMRGAVGPNQAPGEDIPSTPPQPRLSSQGHEVSHGLSGP
jgi:glycosyltransferase involved in cell wall biosynthesis